MRRRSRNKSGGRVVLLVVLVLLAAAAIWLVSYLRGCGGLCNPVTSPQVSDGSSQTPPGTQSNPQKPATMTAVTGSVEGGEDLSEVQRQLMQDLLNGWYMFIGGFQEQDLTSLFSDSDDAALHMAACRTLVAIRSAALEDLHLTSVAYALRVTDVTWPDADHVRVEADETTHMRFAATPDVDSQMYAVPHIFELAQQADGTWQIAHHEADDNPFFSFNKNDDDTVGDTDAKLPRILRAIERRQLLRQETAQVMLACDHPYDRAAALDYLHTYIDQRNSAWPVYDEWGGNCMNFASQVLHAGGIPMDESGDEVWYCYGGGSLDLSWINVGNFYDYARNNEGYGLVADTEAGYYTGQEGDLLILGTDGGLNHTTTISGLVKDETGDTVDYLISSNTTNYRDFPAGAYYYTSQRLIKIWGWND